MHQKEYTGSIVRAPARPESDPDDPRQWAWVEAAVWTDRMLAALGNGVRGGKWHTLAERNVSMEMRHRFDLISVEMQPPFGLNSRLQVG
jgi:hypothetical protein